MRGYHSYWLFCFIILLLITNGVLCIVLCVNVFAHLNDTDRVENLDVSALHSASGFIQNDSETGKDECIAPEPEYSLKPNPVINQGAIFVSIASYRDIECSLTVKDLFRLATNPDRVFVGVTEQNKKGEAKESCIYSCPDCKARLDKGQIRIQHLEDKEARGPSFARWAASKLWNGEEFFLMVDSHSYFEKGWDQDLLDQWNVISNPKAIITSYPPTKEQMKSMKANNFSTTCANCSGSYDSGIFKARAGIIKLKTPGVPQRIPFLAAGFFFGRYTLLYDCPWDPWASAFVFFAEEAMMAMGLYKAGYDFFCPSKPVLSHHYGRPKSPKFFEQGKWGKCKDRAESRAKYHLGLLPLDKVHPDYRKDIDKYYTGKVRTAQQYLEWIKFDAVGKKVGLSLCT